MLRAEVDNQAKGGIDIDAYEDARTEHGMADRRLRHVLVFSPDRAATVQRLLTL